MFSVAQIFELVRYACIEILYNPSIQFIQVNQKLLSRESDWWDVGLVVQKARKQGTVC